MSKPFVVLGQGTGAELIAKYLGCSAIAYPPSKKERRRLFKTHTVINCGWSTRWAHVNSMGRDRAWVKNKVLAADAMRNAGVTCITYESVSEAEMPPVYPYLLRKSKHSKGRDIIVVRSQEDRPTDMYGYYFVPIFPKTREFRVHIVNGEAVKLHQKMPHEDDKEGVVWNNATATFVRRDLDNPLYGSVIEQAKRAVNALGLTFGAVDVGSLKLGNAPGHTRKCGKCAPSDDRCEECDHKESIKVFEVNTAPALNDESAQRYAEVFKTMFNQSVTTNTQEE